MADLVDGKTRVIVQGLGKQGSFHTRLMLEQGTRIVGAVSLTKKGKFCGVPVYQTVEEAVAKRQADFSILFIPAKYARKPALEALENGLNLVIITEGIPVHDSLEIIKKAKEKNLLVIGPNSPGIISPGKTKIGIMPVKVFKKGAVGVVSRSGTLTYEVVWQLTRQGIGQSTVAGIGGDPVIGVDFVNVLEFFKNDPQTKSVVLIGEIGGRLEEKASSYIKHHFTKPVVAYVAGRTAPPEKRMGHAGAIIAQEGGTALSKINALKKAGVKVAKYPWSVPKLLASNN